MKKITWGGLSKHDKKELSNLKVLNEIYSRAIFGGFADDVFSYMTNVLDPTLLIDLLEELDVHFVKEERDLILDEDDGYDNVDEIAIYICDEIDRNKSNLKVDMNKIEKMDNNDFETFYDNYDTVEMLEEYLSENPSVKRDFVTFCVKKIQGLDNK